MVQCVTCRKGLLDSPPGRYPSLQSYSLLAACGADLGHGRVDKCTGLVPLGSGGIVEVTAGGHCELRDQQRTGSLTGLCLSFLVASCCLKNSNKKRRPD